MGTFLISSTESLWAFCLLAFAKGDPAFTGKLQTKGNSPALRSRLQFYFLPALRIFGLHIEIFLSVTADW